MGSPPPSPPERRGFMESIKSHESQIMGEVGQGQQFSLLGGPLHRLGCRLGLVRERTNTVKLGLMLGILPWAVLLSLALIDGLGDEFFSIRVIGAHVRLLVLIPLLFVCESVLHPRMATFVDWTLRSRAVAASSLPALETEVVRIGRWKDSWLLELLCLAAAVMVQPLAEQTGAMGFTATHDPAHVIAGESLAAWWWWHVCLPLARFLLLRWFARLALWSYFLWRVSRMELNLLAHHPDGAGGLGGLETVHRYFMPMIVALSAVVSASIAEEITAGTMVFEEVYHVLPLTLVIVMVLFLGPVLVFTPKLQAARLEGNRNFRNFAARYVKEFDSKWLGPATSDEPLLGTPDIQSLADLANSASTVREMRVIAVSHRILKSYAMSVVLPFLPLLLLKYPVAELAAMLLKRLSGL